MGQGIQEGGDLRLERLSVLFGKMVDAVGRPIPQVTKGTNPLLPFGVDSVADPEGRKELGRLGGRAHSARRKRFPEVVLEADPRRDHAYGRLLGHNVRFPLLT
jgi:hypothetical protein